MIPHYRLISLLGGTPLQSPLFLLDRAHSLQINSVQIIQHVSQLTSQFILISQCEGNYLSKLMISGLFHVNTPLKAYKTSPEFSTGYRLK